MTTKMRPFDPTPDLLPDAQAIDGFMGQGMAQFSALTAHFGLGQDDEGALQLGIALQAYAKNDFELSANSLHAFAAVESRLAALGQVFEVLYKVVNRGSGEAAEHWLKFAVDLYTAHPRVPEAQRLALEFFTYYGLWDHALSIHARLPQAAFVPWHQHIMLSHARAQGFQPGKRFSFVLLTWNRAELLDRCLTEIRAKAGSNDYEIIVGVNASSDHTARVLEKHGIAQVHWNSRNDSIDYYRKVFEVAQGATIIEIDDNVVELPESFDLLLEQHLQIFPEYGFLAFRPTRLDSATGVRTIMESADAPSYQRIERAGRVIHAGPAWGCCAAIAKRDWLAIGGFYGVKMSKVVGEEPQIIRKLRMRGRDGAQIHGPTLLKVY